MYIVARFRDFLLKVLLLGLLLILIRRRKLYFEAAIIILVTKGEKAPTIASLHNTFRRDYLLII